MGFSSKPNSLNIGSKTCSKPNTLPNIVPNIIAEIPHGSRILPIAIFLSFHIRIPAMVRQKPCPKSANIIPKITVYVIAMKNVGSTSLYSGTPYMSV